MKLIGAVTSPYVRKVRIVMAEKKLEFDLELADVWKSDDILQSNPLGKIPCLVMEGGEAVFDSRVIVEYLDTLSPVGKLIPAAGRERAEVRTWEALADGILDACILQVYEKRFRPEDRREVGWVAYQSEKVKRAMHWLEQGGLPQIGAQPDGGAITLAAALGYLDLRFEGQWRNDFPKLVGWLRDFDAAVPAFALTAPPKS